MPTPALSYAGRLIAAIGFAAMSTESHAAGFQITEQSVTGLGRAFSGFGVTTDDLSAAFYNPAGMTLLDGTQTQAGLTFISATGDFDNKGSTQNPRTNAFTFVPALTGGRDDDGGTNSLVPNLYYVREVADRGRFGLAITAPFGLLTDYRKGWVGRYHALESGLKTVDIHPSYAHRVTDRLSVSIGVSAQYGEATLSRAIFDPFRGPDGFAEVTGDDWGFGYTLGLLYEFSPETRAGVSYRSKVKHELEGKRTIRGLTGASAVQNGMVGAMAEAELPESVFVGGLHRLDEQWEVTAGVRWTRWSRFDELRIQFDDGTADDVTPEDWENVWFVALGVDYHHDAAWTLRAGFALDESPVPSAERRTPRIPDSDRTWLSFGASYRPSENLSLDVGYAHLFFDGGDVNATTSLLSPETRAALGPLAPAGTFTDTLAGEFSGRANLLGVQFRYRF